MRLVVLGSAGSYPSADSACASYLVQADDESGRTWCVLLDLGNGAVGPLQRYWNVRDLDAVAISHLHADHVADTAVLSVARRYGPQGPLPPLPLWGPAGTAARLAEIAGSDDPAPGVLEQFDVRAWDPAVPVVVGPLTLTPVAMDHSLPCFGVRVVGPSDEPAPGGGRRTVRLCYTGDTDAGPGLDALAAGADLLLAEAAFHEGRDDAWRGIHLTGRRAAEAAARGGAGQLVLTHIPAWNDPALAVAEARSAYPGPVTLATPGATFTL